MPWGLKTALPLTVAAALFVILADSTVRPSVAVAAQSGDELLIVDCLLPGKVRRLGSRVTYVTARKGVKTTASDCEIRGGEYTSSDRANYATALKIWLPLAKDGDPEAQAYLGEIYEKGLGVEPQYDIAAQWYRKAAEQNLSRAQIALGALYEKGLGVPKDPRQAMEWFRRASGLSEAAVPFIPASVETELNQLRSERAELGREREQLVAERQELQRERAALQSELDALRRQLEGARRNLEDRRSQSDQSRRLLFAREQELEVLRSKGGVTSAESARIAELQRELERRRAEQSAQARELEGLRSRVAGLNKDVGRLQVTVEEEANRRRTEVGQAREEAAKARQELAAVQDRQRQAMAELKSERKSVAAREAELARLSSELQRAKSSTSTDDGRLARIYQELQSREAELDSQRQRIASLSGEVAALSEEAAKAQAAERLLQAAVKEEEARRKTEVGQALSEVERARAALERVLAQRREAEAALAQARQATAAREAELAKLAAALNEARSSGQSDEARLAQLSAELAAREAALAEQRQKTAALSGEVTALRTRTAQAEAAAEESKPQETAPAAATDEPPQIAILDPAIPLTRGVALSVNDAMPVVQVSSGSERLVIGKVDAPLGLLALIVNDQETEVGKSGVFRATVALELPRTTVNIVAIDTEGRRSSKQFALVPKGGDALARSTEPDSLVKLALGEKVTFGGYHALVIGNNDYAMLPKLKSAVGDAEAVASILKQRYGFKTTLILNAGRYAILSALNKLREELTEDDNLLIYYAGHGELDRVNNRGHWLPVDAEPDSSANWISNIQITDVLNAMAARQVLVVADSCYSGTLTRAAVASLDAGMSNKARLNWIKVMADKRSRVVLSSGGVQPVLDQGGGSHSVFAAAFLDVLNGNDDIMEGQRLYRAVSERVTSSAAAASVEQIPQFAPIKFAGHEAGDFFFVPATGG